MFILLSSFHDMDGIMPTSHETEQLKMQLWYITSYELFFFEYKKLQK